MAIRRRSISEKPGRPEFDAVRQRAVFKEALGTLQQAIEELGDATTGKATALG